MSEPTDSERTVRLVRPPTENDVGILAIQDKQRTSFYAFREIPCEIEGRAFGLHKLGLGTLYYVRVGRREESSCECLGFLRHSNCRHLMALSALIRAGLLPKPNNSQNVEGTEQ